MNNWYEYILRTNETRPVNVNLLLSFELANQGGAGGLKKK